MTAKGKKGPGEGPTQRIDKYSVDYYKAGELVLEGVKVPDIRWAKINGLAPEDPKRPYKPRANAMRVFQLKADGERGRELGFYAVGLLGRWHREYAKNAHEPSSVYEEKVRHSLEQHREHARRKVEREEAQRQAVRDRRAERLEPELQEFCRFVGIAYSVNVPEAAVVDYLTLVREGDA